ncbi:MAG: 1,4-alpha-glucan branching protein [Candidatus Brocadia sp.]|nr:1,4-alpha-glucan branching protein [Candidatus Brocadia sp.]
MKITQDHISLETMMGANLVADGVSFRVWAPRAQAVYVNGRFGATDLWNKADADLLLRKDGNGYWTGFLRGAQEGDQYLFYVVGGPGRENFKRDPYARELTTPDTHPGTLAYPACNCIIRRSDSYNWRVGDFRPPAFNDLIIYELHIGTFFAVDQAGRDRRGTRGGQYLDVVDRVTHLRDLGVNAVELLPIHEFASPISRGYDGVDLFSPEMDYAESSPQELQHYLDKINTLLRDRNAQELTLAEIRTQVDQLKALIDVCHLYGLAVIFDVVYNHAGGAVKGQTGGLWFFDEAPRGNDNNSLYFIDKEHAGGPVFAFWNEDVQGFLINNARFFLQEYKVDGLRYDQVTVIDEHGGWFFAQRLAEKAREVDTRRPHISEFWHTDRFKSVLAPPAGLGFDANWHDSLRDVIRAMISQAAGGRNASVRLNDLAAALRNHPSGFPFRWQVVEYLESHDAVDVEHDDRKPRIPALADATNARSWFATSRSRVASGLLMTSPGIPMLFMGQEFLEDKFWTDNDGAHPGLLIYWKGLETEKTMKDFFQFMKEIVWLRRKHPALRSEAINVFYVHEVDRVIAFHRWIEGRGRDVVVVCSLNESTFWSYNLGFPQAGQWLEVFNSDVYENWVNPWVAGNGGSVFADGPGVNNLPASATVVLPANGVVVFARDPGD